MDFDKLFSTFQKEAFRLECLPSYIVEEETEAIRYFEATGELPEIIDDGWNDLLDDALKRGKPVRRLRLLHEPLTSYEKFELAAYEQNIAHGEDIRTTPASKHPNTNTDFWIFDMKWIVLIKYASDGTFLASETREATDDEIAQARYWHGIFNESASLGS